MRGPPPCPPPLRFAFPSAPGTFGGDLRPEVPPIQWTLIVSEVSLRSYSAGLKYPKLERRRWRLYQIPIPQEHRDGVNSKIARRASSRVAKR